MAGERRSTFAGFLNFGKNFGNKSRPQSFTEVDTSDLTRRTLSDPGNGYISDGYSHSIQQDLDNLVTENDEAFSSQFTTSHPSSTGASGTNIPKSTSLLRINREHWKDRSKFSYCKRCAKAFGFAGRKFNCRRCGKVFCEQCCQYRKRLNSECMPDPQGNIHRVCYNCSDLHTQALGECRSLTEDFLGHRKNKRMIISKELQRLTKGFEANVDPTAKLKNLADSFLGIIVPEWQKSRKWLESQEVEWCTKCSSKFSLLNKKHHCRVCGSVYCRHCCKNDLLLYYDECGNSVARLIHVVGCPDNEPSVCCYLPVCVLCHDDLEEYQVQQFHLTLNNVDSDKGNIGHISLVLDQLRNVERRLDNSLPRFQEMVEAYVFEQQYENLAGQTNGSDFALLQGDISDLFSKYTAIIQGLKQYKLTSPTEMRIMKNITNVKCTSYNEQMNLFKKLKSILNKSLPARELEELQEKANTQAINNTFVTARQLGFEALALAETYGFETSIAERLSGADAVCFQELKKYVESTGEDWTIHHKVLNALLKDQLAKKRLIKPSQSLAKRDGAKYVNHFLMQRSFTILFQISTALKAKSSEEKFTGSKEALKELLNELNVLLKEYGPCY